MMAARIEAVRENDLPSVVRIEREAFSDPWTETSFGRLLGEPNVMFACARQDDGASVAGYVVAWFAADEAEIANLAVAAAARRRGIGHALLQAALAEARRRGARTIYLEVRDSNEAARRLYRSAGFAEVGRRRGYYRRPAEDAIVLSKTLERQPNDGPASVR